MLSTFFREPFLTAFGWTLGWLVHLIAPVTQDGQVLTAFRCTRLQFVSEQNPSWVACLQPGDAGDVTWIGYDLVAGIGLVFLPPDGRP